MLVQRSPSTFGNKDNVIFAIPGRVTQTFKLVHRVSSFRLVGGSRLKVSTVEHILKNQTSTASPAEPGGFLLVAIDLSINDDITTTWPVASKQR
jgi:hypothetical protein